MRPGRRRASLSPAALPSTSSIRLTETQVRLVDEIGVQSVAISRDGQRVVSGGWGDSIGVWSVGPSFDDSARRDIDGDELSSSPPVAGLAGLDQSGLP